MVIEKFNKKTELYLAILPHISMIQNVSKWLKCIIVLLKYDLVKTLKLSVRNLVSTWKNWHHMPSSLQHKLFKHLYFKFFVFYLLKTVFLGLHFLSAPSVRVYSIIFFLASGASEK